MPKQDPTARAFHEQFRVRLKSLRETDMDWTQAQMAEALNVPLENYKKYENRGGFPIYLVTKLAWLTHQDVEFILTGQHKKPRTVRDRAA